MGLKEEEEILNRIRRLNVAEERAIANEKIIQEELKQIRESKAKYMKMLAEGKEE